LPIIELEGPDKRSENEHRLKKDSTDSSFGLSRRVDDEASFNLTNLLEIPLPHIIITLSN
jgi:hypothetical protein